MNNLRLSALPLSTMSTNSTDRNRAEESVDIVDIVDGVDRPGDAAHASDQAGARLWRVEWPDIEPTLIEYQEPVTFERVLSEHRAAVAACPVKVGPPLRGSFPGSPAAGNSNPDLPLEIAFS